MSSAEAASSAAPPSPGVVQQSSITIVVPNDARGPKPRVIATTPDGQTIQADLPGAKPGERVVLMYTPLSAAAGDAEPASPRASAHEADAVAPIPSTSSSPAPAGPPHAGPPHAGPASGAGARRGSSGRGREMSIQDKLTRARKVANRRRWLVGTPRIATALLLGTLLGCLLVAWRALGIFETLPLFAAYAPLVPFAMPSVLLVLQPIDRTATRLVGHTVSATAALVVLGELFVVGVFHSSSPVRHLIDSCAEARLVFGHAAFMVISLPTLAYFAARTTPCAGCCACAGGCCCGGEGDASAAVARAERVQSKQRALLSRLWGATGVLYLAHACAGLILSACLLMHPEWTTRSGGFLVLVVAVELGLLGLVCVVQRWRRWLQRKLASRVNGDVAAAAAIADLISAAEGDTAVQDADPAAEARRVMKQAAARMRAVTLDRLTVDEFSQREGAVGMLYARSQPAKVGLIDAFVSHRCGLPRPARERARAPLADAPRLAHSAHGLWPWAEHPAAPAPRRSWHDDAPGKWAALMAWRAEFVRKNGREPIVWLDKCCIECARACPRDASRRRGVGWPARARALVPAARSAHACARCARDAVCVRARARLQPNGHHLRPGQPAVLPRLVQHAAHLCRPDLS